MIKENIGSDSFFSFVEKLLNREQKLAVIPRDGSLFVVAGAGSGKTRVITARITNLMLMHNVNPSQIIALTFTNKAAQEMKERIARFLPATSSLPFVGTFHGYCLRMLKQYSSQMAHPFTAILDADDQQKMIKTLLQKNGLQKIFLPREVAHKISHIKNNYLDMRTASRGQIDERIYELYRAYEHEKMLNHCLDFDDLLLEMLKILRIPTIAEQFHESIRHILVDEYQDTNVVQHDLLKTLCLVEKEFVIDSLCAVGDEDQSIYSWRGATIANIRGFTHDFPQTTIIKIEQNYRSVQPILDLANSVIEHNNIRSSKKLWSLKKGTNRVYLLNFSSEYQESDALARLFYLVKERGNLASTAVFYRTHAQSRALEEALVRASIPYRIIGGTQFYDRMEIKDLLAYIKLIVNPFDRVSLKRILNVPSRKLGTKCEELFFALWESETLSSWNEVAQLLLSHDHLTTIQKTSLTNFISLFSTLSPITQPSKALESIISGTRYLTYIKDTYEKEEATERLANIDELMNAFRHFEQDGSATLPRILEEIALMQDNNIKTDKDHNVVLMMTLHAAKGLEFDTVILTGLEEGLLPTSRSLDKQELIEEERRLLYVGITRARERLLMTHTKCRYTYGAITTQKRSRFVEELPQHLVPHHDVGFWKQTELLHFFTQWLGFTKQDSSECYVPNDTKKSSSVKNVSYD